MFTVWFLLMHSSFSEVNPPTKAVFLCLERTVAYKTCGINRQPALKWGVVTKNLFKLLRLILLAPAIFLFAADGDGGAGGNGGDGKGSNTGGDGGKGGNDDKGNGAGGDQGDKGSGSGDGKGGGVEKLNLTQADLDAIIEKRLARDRKEREKAAEDEKKKAAMTEAERLKAEKEEADKKAQAAQEAADQRIIKAELKVQAAALGVKPEKLAYVTKLADISGIDVTDGEPDAKAIKKAVEAVIKDLPELVGGKGNGSVGGGANPGGSGGASGGMNDFIRKAAGR
jgi:Membrane protein involved in colicin uptake